MIPIRIFSVLPFLVVLFFAITGLFQWLYHYAGGV
ncbi:hypothetical protein MTCOM_20190 [Moorella thermoacetica]|uniref:Uncharacterized protein n=2 Tax=Neomoorella thermoacetica TaxID=1525 RepID=A0A1J5JWX6_NEOTH|nr:hypothetical protein MOOR_13580 [Moorella thermoacetica]OIQ11195.1 hypothetical protein MOOTH_19270 [Moorella thermoacetica]GAF25203.1 hypothetical protein MTY_0533 [Moorella thermoacetica Y72]